MKLKDGYVLMYEDIDSGATCGNGGHRHAYLMYNGVEIATFDTCVCGRGCGNRDCVRDDWGAHDCEPAIEAVRDD